MKKSNMLCLEWGVLLSVGENERIGLLCLFCFAGMSVEGVCCRCHPAILLNDYKGTSLVARRGGTIILATSL